MANTLESIELPDGAIWTADTEIGESDVLSTVLFSLNQTPNIWEVSKSGKYIDIVGSASDCWIERGDLMALKALNTPGAILTLIYSEIEYSVRPRNEDVFIMATPAKIYDEQNDTDLFHSLIIKLQEM